MKKPNRKRLSSLSDKKIWDEFEEWCQVLHVKPLPANPWAVATYVRSRENKDEIDLISKRLKVIARKHLTSCVAAPDKHPMVTRAVDLVEKRAQHQGLHGDLFEEDEFLIKPKILKRPEAGEIEPAQKKGRPFSVMRAQPKLVSRRPPKRPK